MVLSFGVNYIFKYPIDLVANTYLNKYPTEKEKDVLSVKTVKKVSDNDGVEYWHRIACCNNVVPSILRKLRDLDRKYVYIEEECWLDHLSRKFIVRSRNLTWEQYVRLKEESLFQQAENPNWTQFHQCGTVDVHGLGHFGWLIERFAESFFQRNIKKDRHATGKSMPTIDKHQDWELLWSHENETHTLLRFQRKINTCDKKEDLKILKPSVRIIYAYGEEDPVSPNSVKYHGSENRGTKSIFLLETRRINLGSPEDLLYWDVRAPNISVPGDTDTSYLCTVIRRPQMDSLHHILKVEPIIQPGNEKLVHHMILFECTDGNETQLEPLTKGYHACYTEDQTPNFSYCFTGTATWAVGGEVQDMPEKVGLPLGRSNAVYYVLEVHYDNPGYRSGVIDNSGLRITYTPKLRKYNGGILAIGNLWYACMFIPPGQKEFIVAGHAHPGCLRQSIPPRGIKIFSVLLHAHLTGRKMRVRHFRGRKELPPIISDETYDFNYQDAFTLSEEVKVLPTDHLIVECSYDSTKRNETTFGGLSTHEEMCLAFLYYYPEVQLSLSVSCPSPINVLKPLGVTDLSSDDRYLISPITGKNESYVDFLNNYPWNENSIDAVQTAMKYSPHLNMCSDRGGKFKLVFDLARYPNRRKVYREPDECLINKFSRRI